MPIYEFRCERCEAVFEKIVYNGDDTDLNCPQCGSAETMKLVSRTGAVGGHTGESCSIDASKNHT